MPDTTKDTFGEHEGGVTRPHGGMTPSASSGSIPGLPPRKPRLTVNVIIDFKHEKECMACKWPDSIMPQTLYSDALNYRRVGTMDYIVCPHHYRYVLDLAEWMTTEQARLEVHGDRL